MGPHPSIELLKSAGQDELIDWLADSEHKDKLLDQVAQIDKTTPNGLVDYCARARGLLASSMKGENPFENYIPEVPNGKNLTPENQEEFSEYEEAGLCELDKTAFVLIAGGLGERLGFSSIKISLPVSCMADDYSYMKYYCNYILACQVRVWEMYQKKIKIPLAIMVSGDTNDKTIKLLEDYKYFGL